MQDRNDVKFMNSCYQFKLIFTFQ